MIIIKKLRLILFKSNKSIKDYVTKACVKPTDEISKENTLKFGEWNTALPYQKIPGPSKIAFLTAFLPGGKFSNMQLTDIHRQLKNDYGDLIRLPGVFGKRDLILIYSPENFEKIYRTEGIWPIRKGLDIIAHYRLVRKEDQFKDAEGLTAVQGEPWAKFRTVVNPVMMQSKTIKIYVPKIDKVAEEFIKRIKIIRDSKSNEVHGTFLQDINHLTLESICVVALDAQLNLINGANNPEAQRLITAMSTFFELIYELDVKPSIWKICKTPTFYRMMEAFDTVTEIATKYIDEAIVKSEIHEQNDERLDNEKSVLERLLKIDKKIAMTMAMDLLLAGVDTTASAFTSCFLALALNPEKQNNLRTELLSALPDKHSPITNEKLKMLPYLRACIKEALRIYPVTIGNFRTTGQDIVLNNYQIPKDSDILMSNILLKKNNLYFGNGENYIPERWLRQQENNNDIKCSKNKVSHPFAYLPFGFGPRMCIGRRIVELELEIGLAKVIRNFYIEYDYPENEVFKTNLINVPKAELKFKFADVKC